MVYADPEKQKEYMRLYREKYAVKSNRRRKVDMTNYVKPTINEINSSSETDTEEEEPKEQEEQEIEFNQSFNYTTKELCINDIPIIMRKRFYTLINNDWDNIDNIMINNIPKGTFYKYVSKKEPRYSIIKEKCLKSN